MWNRHNGICKSVMPEVSTPSCGVWQFSTEHILFLLKRGHAKEPRRGDGAMRAVWVLRQAGATSHPSKVRKRKASRGSYLTRYTLSPRGGVGNQPSPAGCSRKVIANPLPGFSRACRGSLQGCYLPRSPYTLVYRWRSAGQRHTSPFFLPNL